MKPSVLITFILCGTAILFIPFLGAVTHIDVGDDYKIACVLVGAAVLLMSMISALGNSQSATTPACQGEAL